MKLSDIEIKINVVNIDEVIAKVSRLNELLKEANALIDSLRNLKVEVKN